ncbi:TetR/AcrR family transcriptional regulator [Gordonia polyisoprenivorans]|uniref:TetR/AcrR family transcriptional regulator n=1 Tax=Gordonia polyisoprenivorans TaxID=84595 RepID=UPI0023000946|nr:TetR/AcrR family transcriptional regulator [Gordonia polyisoprenivorans]WCB35407.1 TetR/AcrR family transcriptional regulator [Gordonia polyisoprenivorans]
MMVTRANSGERRRRRPTKSGAVLTEQMIIDAATRLLRLHGSQGLSVRRLGVALGADQSALYRYFSGIDDLRLAIADEMIGRALHGLEITGDWRRDLRDFGLRGHAAYLADPQVAVLAASRITGRPQEARAIELVLGILRTAGLDERRAAYVYRALVDQMLAFAALDGAELAVPADTRTDDAEKWQSVYAELSTTDFPNIAAAADDLVAIGRKSAYPTALDLTLDGIEALLIRRGRHPQEPTLDG